MKYIRVFIFSGLFWVSVLYLTGVGQLVMIYWFWVHDCLLCTSMVKYGLCFLPLPLSLYTNARPLLSRSRRLSSPSSRSPLVASSLCLRKTPASVPTPASQTASMVRRRVAGRRRWMSMATRCTSATILMRRYRLLRVHLMCLHWGGLCIGKWVLGWCVDNFFIRCMI